MELTYACRSCGAVSRVSDVESVREIRLRGLRRRPARPRRGLRGRRSRRVRLLRDGRPLPPEGLPAGARPGDRGRRVRDQHGLLVLRAAAPGRTRSCSRRPCSTWSFTTGCPTSRSATVPRPVPGAGSRTRAGRSPRSTWRSASAIARSGSGSRSTASSARADVGRGDAHPPS